MASPGKTAMDYQMVPEDGHGVPERTPDPAGAILAGDPRSPASAASGYTDATAPGSAAGEPGAAGKTDAERPLAVPAPRAAPGPARPSPAAKDSTRWHDIQAMFIDDPRASTELAAGLVDASVEALVVAVRERQKSLLSAWQGDDAGTGELRTTLQQYRAFWNRLEDFPREA
jgi:hypothetical protein